MNFFFALTHPSGGVWLMLSECCSSYCPVTASAFKLTTTGRKRKTESDIEPSFPACVRGRATWRVSRPRGVTCLTRGLTVNPVEDVSRSCFKLQATIVTLQTSPHLHLPHLTYICPLVQVNIQFQWWWWSWRWVGDNKIYWEYSAERRCQESTRRISSPTFFILYLIGSI